MKHAISITASIICFYFYLHFALLKYAFLSLAFGAASIWILTFVIKFKTK